MLKLFFWTFGSFIQAAAMSIFLFPHAISSGGAAGISIILDHVFQTPYAVSIWGVNAVMIVLAIKWLGFKTAAGTMYCVTAAVVVIDLLAPFFTTPVGPVWLDLPAGAIVFGIGVGILFKFDASSGGMSIAALILSKLYGWPSGRALFYINTLVLIAAGIVVDMQTIIYAVICQWISSGVIDGVQSFSFSFLQKKLLPRR